MSPARSWVALYCVSQHRLGGGTNSLFAEGCQDAETHSTVAAVIRVKLGVNAAIATPREARMAHERTGTPLARRGRIGRDWADHTASATVPHVAGDVRLAAVRR